MKKKRHYFYFQVSILNTIFFVLFGVFFFVSAVFTALSGNIGNFIVCISLFIATILTSCIFVIYDGWAAWEIANGQLVVTKLFRKKRSISLGKVNLIFHKKIDVLFIFDCPNQIDGYARSGDGVTVVIPKTEASDALVEEIKRTNILPPALKHPETVFIARGPGRDLRAPHL